MMIIIAIKIILKMIIPKNDTMIITMTVTVIMQ